MDFKDVTTPNCFIIMPDQTFLGAYVDISGELGIPQDCGVAQEAPKEASVEVTEIKPMPNGKKVEFYEGASFVPQDYTKKEIFMKMEPQPSTSRVPDESVYRDSCGGPGFYMPGSLSEILDNLDFYLDQKSDGDSSELNSMEEREDTPLDLRLHKRSVEQQAECEPPSKKQKFNFLDPLKWGGN